MAIYRDKKRDTWFCKFYYKNGDGKTRQCWKRGFATREDALSFEKDFLNHNLRDLTDEIFERIYDQYIVDVGHTLKKTTVAVKKSIFNKWILPSFGRRKIIEITPLDIRKWQQRLMDDEHHYTQSYIRAIFVQLSSFFKYIDRIYGLPSNPCMHAGSMTGRESREREFWTLDEYRQFREANHEDVLAFTCFETLYWTGIREGELLALSPEDIDKEGRTLRINKTYSRINGEDYIRTPKTKAACRTVSIPEFLCDELMEYVGLMGVDARVDGDTRTDVKTHIRLFPVQRYFLEKTMRKYSRIAGVKRIRIHSIRRSAVSLLVYMGFAPLEISRRIGHEKVSTTLDIYADLFPMRQTEIALGLERIYRAND